MQTESWILKLKFRIAAAKIILIVSSNHQSFLISIN